MGEPPPDGFVSIELGLVIKLGEPPGFDGEVDGRVVDDVVMSVLGESVGDPGVDVLDYGHFLLVFEAVVSLQ